MAALCGGVVLSLGPGVCQAAPAHSVGALRFIGEQRVAHKLVLQDTVVGGLSGLDYDPASGVWILESDDRSQWSPARFYTASLRLDASGFTAFTLTGVHTFKQADGGEYPGTAGYLLRGGEVADIESIRYDPRDASIWYASEGNRILGMSPFVKHADRDGAKPAAMALPAMFKMDRSGQGGPRDNLSFEGMSFAPDGDTLWLAMEAPLYQDGPLPTPSSGALARITHLDRAGTVLGQYAYPIGPIPAAPGPGMAADNGVSEILAVDAHRLLVLEHSGVQDSKGRYRNYARLYEIDVAAATDIIQRAALPGEGVQPVSKRLVLDLNTLGLDRIDNLEGMAWGPKLPDGHDSLVLVSDDNFNASQVTQLLAFDVAPESFMGLAR
jgi:hypothetical protein